MNLVLDASVIAKWFFQEEKTDLALDLLEKHKSAENKINAPILLLFEFGNTFVNKFREDINTKTEFNRGITDLLSIDVNFIDSNEENLKQTYAIARKYQITFYDAAYLACAQKLNCGFVTADKKLYAATKGLKFVKLLGKTS